MSSRRENFGRGKGRGRSGNMNKPPPNPNDKNSPKKIKTEQLRQAGYLVSPEIKSSKFTIKQVINILKQQDNSNFREDELKEMLLSWRKFKRQKTSDIKNLNYHQLVQELQTAQKQLLLQDECDFAIDEVEAILRESKINQLSVTMEIEQLREMLKVWNHHKQIYTPNIKELSHTEIIHQLEKAQHSLDEENLMQPSECLMDEIDRETDQLFDVVTKMNITGKTSDEQIFDFNDEELAYFQYVKSLKVENHLGLEDLKEVGRTQLVKFCQAWRNAENKKESVTAAQSILSSEDEDDLYDLKTTGDSNTQSTKQSTIDPKEPAPMEIDSTLDFFNIDYTEDDINSFTKEQKCKWVHQKSKETEDPIQLATLNLWPKNQIEKTIQSILNKNKPKQKKSNLKKDSKYTNPNGPIQVDLEKNIMRPWRYSLFMTSPPDKKGIEGLITYLSDIFHEMGSFCPGIQLLPWDDDNFGNGLDDCEDIPKTINQLKKYFKGVRSPTGVNKQYLRIRLGFPIQSDRPTFEADMIGWCNSREIRMFECALQHPDAKVVGWLAYMPNTMDRKKWCITANELNQHVNRKNNQEEIKLGMVWKALSGQWDVPQKKKVYAMHVEAGSDQVARVKKFLRMASQLKKYPLGVRFRLMDEYHQYMKESTKIKYNYLFDKHKTLSSEMRQMETSSILNLDGKIGSIGKTLRDIVTNIRDKRDERRVFNSIDRKYNNPNVYVIQYRPDKAELAKAHILSLATYVKHTYPNQELKKVFTVEALEESKVETYFPENQTFITQEDIDLDAVIQDDLNDDSFEYLNVNNVNPFEIQIPEQLKGGDKLYNLSGDDDTASTNPAHSSTISFSNASVHLYDTKSLVSELSSTMSEQNKLSKISAKPTRSNKVRSMGETSEA